MSDPRIFDPTRAPYLWHAIGRPARDLPVDCHEVIPLPGRRVTAFVSSGTGDDDGAMWMVLCRSVYRMVAQRGASPREVLLEVHRLLVRDAPGVTQSAVGVEIRLDRREIVVARAGDAHALLRHTKGGEVDVLPGTDQPLGALVEEDLGQREVPWEREDLLLLAGHGCVRLRGPGGALFGLDRLAEALRTAPAATREAAEHCDRLLATHAGSASPSDDISLVCFLLRGGEAAS